MKKFLFLTFLLAGFMVKLSAQSTLSGATTITASTPVYKTFTLAGLQAYEADPAHRTELAGKVIVINNSMVATVINGDNGYAKRVLLTAQPSGSGSAQFRTAPTCSKGDFFTVKGVYFYGPTYFGELRDAILLPPNSPSGSTTTK